MESAPPLHSAPNTVNNFCLSYPWKMSAEAYKLPQLIILASEVDSIKKQNIRFRIRIRIKGGGSESGHL